MHVVLAFSGGVDSTAAALLLLQAGHRVSGVFMSHPWQSARDADDAAAIAGQLGIAFHIVDFSAAFEKLVDTFADEYFAGRTPNPCALCNRDIKFGLLFDAMQQLGGDFLATGHYIRCISHEQWLTEQGVGDREQGTGSREQGAGRREEGRGKKEIPLTSYLLPFPPYPCSLPPTP